MLTAAALSEADILLVGTLRQRRRGNGASRPIVVLEVWCPACKATHELGWPDVWGRGAVLVVAAPCRSGPWHGRMVAVGPDPSREPEHGRVAQDHKARLRRWRVEERLRREFAARRARDREHLREGWDVVT